MRIAVRAMIVGAFGFVATVNIASAHGVSCAEVPLQPVKPWCLHNLAARVTDDFSFGTCFDALQNYGRAVEQYYQCLGKNSDLISRRYESSAKEFDCFTNGEDDCESNDEVRYNF